MSEEIQAQMTKMSLYEETDVDAVSQRLELLSVEYNNCSKEIKAFSVHTVFTNNMTEEIQTQIANMNLGEETVVDADSQRIELVTVECDNSSKDIRNISVDNAFTDREEATIDSVNQRIELLIVEGNKSSEEIKNFSVDKAFTDNVSEEIQTQMANMNLSEKTDIDSFPQRIELSIVESNNCSKEMKDSNDPKVFTDNNNTVRKKRKYSCEKCLYSAAKKWKLLEHMKYHEKIPGITLFECQKCPFKGPLKSQLDRHMMFLHQNEPDSKRYKCHICDSEFISKSSRSKHKKTHK